MSLLNSRKCLLSYKTLDMKNVNTHYKKGKICDILNIRTSIIYQFYYCFSKWLFKSFSKKKKKSGCSSLSEFLEYQTILEYQTKALFGWGENRKDGKEREENMVENEIFSYLVQEGKQERKKMMWKIIPPGPHNFVSQFGRKTKEKS